MSFCISTFVIAALYCHVALAVIHTSAIIKQVQKVQHNLTTDQIMRCAYLLKSQLVDGFRVAKDSDLCEELQMYQLESFPADFEYFVKETSIREMVTWALWKEFVMHNLFSTVMLGDTFKFDIEIQQNDLLTIEFQKYGTQSRLLIFEATSKALTLNDHFGNVFGNVITPAFPFTTTKEYKVVFEISELHWQIYIDDVAFTTFPHRHPYADLHKIVVMVGPGVNYLSKFSDPKMP